MTGYLYSFNFGVYEYRYPDISGKSGVYSIVCNVNDRMYVGSSIDLRERLTRHRQRLVRNCHSNAYLQNSFNKYGINNFTYNVLEFVCNDELLHREQYYIDKLNLFKNVDGFNLCPNAGSNFGKPTSEKTRERLSIAGKGKKQSSEWIKRRVESRLANDRPGGKLTDDDVIEIVRLSKYTSKSKLAQKFGVTYGTIYAILCRKIRKKVTDNLDFDIVAGLGHKLSREDVLEIRSLHGKMTLKEIGEKFGVSDNHISTVVNRKSWRHIQ